MVRDPDLIISILHYCVNGTPDWRLNLKVCDLFESLPPEEQSRWTADVIEGHVRLMTDAGLIEAKSELGLPNIVRLTWAGHEYLEKLEKHRQLSDNPFLR